MEEELIGEFVKYSVRDGKEINFMRRDSEAGQKCCTFQHWVYEKTSGSLLVTDMQGENLTVIQLLMVNVVLRLIYRHTGPQRNSVCLAIPRFSTDDCRSGAEVHIS